MHNILAQNLVSTCKGCLKQSQCWEPSSDFTDLTLIENNRCINYLR